MTLQILRTRPRRRASTTDSYIERVNLAIDFIIAHIDQPLRLKTISKAAHLSPCHFHRVFQVVTGETIADFVRRHRLERALSMMSHTRPRSLTSIALSCGFASSAEFSRSFKRQYGTSPRAFNLTQWCASRQAALDQTVEAWARQLHIRSLPPRTNPDGFRVHIRDLKPRTVAYIRVRNPYRGDGVVRACNRLIAWSKLNGFHANQWLGYQWENPELTDLANCQYNVAVEADTFTPRGEVGRQRFPAMTVAQVEIKGGLDLELRALRWLYGSWLPRSGFVPADQPGFEAWIGQPFAHGAEHFELHIQLPIKRM